MFFPSPRNSIEAHLSLLKETQATHFIAPTEAPPVLASILKKHRLPKLVIPDLDDILDNTSVEHVSFDRTFDQARMDPFLIPTHFRLYRHPQSYHYTPWLHNHHGRLSTLRRWQRGGQEDWLKALLQSISSIPHGWYHVVATHCLLGG